MAENSVRRLSLKVPVSEKGSSKEIDLEASKPFAGEWWRHSELFEKNHCNRSERQWGRGLSLCFHVFSVWFILSNLSMSDWECCWLCCHRHSESGRSWNKVQKASRKWNRKWSMTILQTEPGNLRRSLCAKSWIQKFNDTRWYTFSYYPLPIPFLATAWMVILYDQFLGPRPRT